MKISPFWKQCFILSGTIYGGISTGCVIGFPTVLINQFQEKNSTIKVNLEDITWLGSVSGIAGLLSVVIPGIMQEKGRKFSFLISTAAHVIGWIITYLATSIEVVLAAAVFLGFGIQSSTLVAMLVISEFASTTCRNFWYNLYAISSVFGTFFVHILGVFTNWKIVVLICTTPSVLGFIVTCFWPETPAWLAYKGRLQESKTVFLSIKGSDQDSQIELEKILKSYNKINRVNNKYLSSSYVRKILVDVWKQCKQKDFYYPMYLVATCIFLYYWSGGFVIRVYVNEMLKQNYAINSVSWLSMTIVDLIVLFGVILFSCILYKFRYKPLFLLSGIFSGLLLFASSMALILQKYELLDKQSLIPFYTTAMYMLVYTVGLYSLPMRVAGELIPVKHRGLGGTITLLMSSIFSSTSLKLTPYLYVYFGLPVLFFIFTVVIIYCIFIITKFMPETKNKTLQETEAYYNRNQKSHFMKNVDSLEASASLVQTKTENDQFIILPIEC